MISVARTNGARFFAAARFAPTAALILLVLSSSVAHAVKAKGKSKPTPTAKPTPTIAVKPFVLDDVSALAEQLAKSPFQDPHGKVPPWLTEISYDQWRDIRFRPERALWRDLSLPFEVQFFHPGLYYDRPVKINQVDATGPHSVPFSPSFFDYGQNKFASQVPQDLGYAGFRVHYPLKTPDYKDELIVFVGASYFRALGRDNVFGMSARGLAIDTGVPAGEEFPYFKEFWLVRPAPNATEITIFALLDSPRSTGAFRFTVHPGEQTLVDVQQRIFLRDRVAKLGIAPLTSMFQHGENTERAFSDYRPEAHDADGLLLAANSGEWIWRPVNNPTRLQISSLEATNLKGFGLLQRDRVFDHYQDLEAAAQLRPSVWITPNGEWGEGTVELVEIPTNTDVNDNIVAFWTPKVLPDIGKPFDIAYKMTWFTTDPAIPPGARVVSTRRDRKDDLRRFVIEFAGSELDTLPPETVLRGIVSVGQPGQAELVEQQVQKNPIAGTWRLVFQVRVLRSEPIELRAYLQQGDKTLTETWSYLMQD